MMKELRIRLKEYMGENDLSIREVALLIGRHPLTIWKFLNGKTEPRYQTICQIKKFLEEHSEKCSQAQTEARG
jgi:transcriptional regulator with XRE-family HTH domain